MSVGFILPAGLQRLKTFQETALLNRGALDALGTDPPMIGMARNPIERREMILNRVIVIGSAFVLAPLHAMAFVWLFKNLYRLGHTQLMRVSFRELNSVAALRRGLTRVSREIATESARKKQWKPPQKLLTDHVLAERMRRSLIKAKSHMLMADLIIEGLIFVTLGWVVTWFGNRLIGKKRFSGELGLVSEETLDKLYARREAKKSFPERLRQGVGVGLAVTVPLILGGLIRKSLLTKSPGPFLLRVRDWARHFDYHRGIFLSLGSLVIPVTMQYIGYLLSARDKHELRERFIRETLMNYIFFAGNWTWLKLLGPIVRKIGKVPAVMEIQKALDKTRGQPRPVRLRAAKTARALYVAVFLLNTLTLAVTIGVGQYLTRKNVRKEVATLTPGPFPAIQP